MKNNSSSTPTLKIVVIGGSGLIGSKVVNNLRQFGHDVFAASPSSGVNTVTGEGLTQALAGVQLVIDVANSPSFEDGPAMEFFQKSGRNLRAAEVAAGIKHHVALSVVGTERLTASGYFRAKLAQEKSIKDSPIPYTIVRATQFFEFTKAIAQGGTIGDSVHLPAALMQPIASDDVAELLTGIALGAPVNGMVEIAGPDAIRQDELIRQYFRATGETRLVVTDPAALYFGIKLDGQSLTPGPTARVGKVHFKDWLKRIAKAA